MMRATMLALAAMMAAAAAVAGCGDNGTKATTGTDEGDGDAGVTCGTPPACQSYLADPLTRTCIARPLADGTACDDADVCSRVDTCAGGVCVGTDLETCTGTNLCNQPSPCDPLSGCPAPGAPCAIRLGGCSAESYSVDVTVGGGGPMALVLDTGSSSLGVASSLCGNCNVTPVYTPGSAATATGSQADAQYGDGAQAASFRGTVYQDTVQLVGGPQVEMRLIAMAAQTNLLVADACPQVAGQVPGIQGILGLGPASLASAHTDGLVAMLGAQTAVGGQFALQLCDRGGTLWLGGYDPAHAAGAMQYTPLLSTTDGMTYSVTVVDMALAGHSLGGSSATYGPADVDSGTTVMLLPQGPYSALVAALEADAAFADNFGSKLFDGTCAIAAKGLDRDALDRALPALSVTLPAAGGGTFTMTVPPTQSYLFVAPVTGSTGQTVYCPAAYPASVTILGASFLRGLVTVFDVAHGQVGFAPQVGCL